MSFCCSASVLRRRRIWLDHLIETVRVASLAQIGVLGAKGRKPTLGSMGAVVLLTADNNPYQNENPV